MKPKIKIWRSRCDGCDGFAWNARIPWENLVISVHSFNELIKLLECSSHEHSPIKREKGN